MPHINEKIDFTVGALIVFKGKVLLIDHIKLKRWLTPGGHIELDEDPDQALFREVEEETGLGSDDLEIIADKPDFKSFTTKALYRPLFVDIHQIDEVHRHVVLIYLFRAKTDKVKLAETEHNGIRWFSKDDLSDPKFDVKPTIKHYAMEAIKQVESQN